MSDTNNDVHSGEFESKMDNMFRSDYEPPVRKSYPHQRRKHFNAQLLGRGMMPPVREKKEEQ